MIAYIFNRGFFIRGFRFLIFAFAVMIAAFVIAYIANPDLGLVKSNISKTIASDIRQAEGLKKVWAYIVNNGFQVPLQMFVFALIPLQFLYGLNIVVTAISPGILFAIVARVDLGLAVQLIVSAMPHIFLELFAYSLLASVLYKLNNAIRKKFRAFIRKESKQVHFLKWIRETGLTYVILVLPIIIVAAFVETYVADFISNLFQ